MALVPTMALSRGHMFCIGLYKEKKKTRKKHILYNEPWYLVLSIIWWNFTYFMFMSLNKQEFLALKLKYFLTHQF